MCVVVDRLVLYQASDFVKRFDHRPKYYKVKGGDLEHAGNLEQGL